MWFASLVTLAAGLASVGFLKWFAGRMSVHLADSSPTSAMLVLAIAFFVLHYMFASVTAHVTALLPILLTVGSAVPGMDMRDLALLLCGTLGIMGILTPYAAGPSPAYSRKRLFAVEGLLAARRPLRRHLSRDLSAHRNAMAAEPRVTSTFRLQALLEPEQVGELQEDLPGVVRQVVRHREPRPLPLRAEEIQASPVSVVSSEQRRPGFTR